MSLIDQLKDEEMSERGRLADVVRGREREIQRVSAIGIVVNLALMAVKATIGLMANSIAIVSDGLNNLTDALSSLLTIIGTRLSGRPADRRHPFGYGRVEYLTTIAIGTFIVFEGACAIRDSLDAIAHPEEVSYDTRMLVIMGSTILVKVVLGLFFRRRGKALSSDALVASGDDALMDVAVTSATIASALATVFCGVSTEAYVALLISVMIVRVGVQALARGASRVVGQRVSIEESAGLRKTVEEVPGVIGSYDWYLSDFGTESVRGSVYVEVDERLSVGEASRIANAVRMAAYARRGVQLDAVGVVPVSCASDIANEMRTCIQEKACAMDHVTGIHGLRLVEESRFVSFDVDVEFGVSDREAMADEIGAWAEETFPGWSFFVTTGVRYVD